MSYTVGSQSSIFSLRYVSSTTHEIIKIPKVLNQDVAYLTGLILGDGCLPNVYRKDEDNFEYRVTVTSGDKGFVRKDVCDLFTTLFSKNSFFEREKENYIDLEIRNKAIFRFFTRVMGLHSGKKAIGASIPKIFFESKIGFQMAFIAGLIDSDIGKHGGSIGCTFRNKKFVEELVVLFNQVGVCAKEGGTYIINGEYPQTDFRIPKREVKTLKRLLSDYYLPKTKARVMAIDFIAGVG